MNLSTGAISKCKYLLLLKLWCKLSYIASQSRHSPHMDMVNFKICLKYSLKSSVNLISIIDKKYFSYRKPFLNLSIDDNAK